MRKNGTLIGPMSKDVAVVQGRFAKHLDTTNACETDVVTRLTRIAVELLEAGYLEHTLRRAVKKIERNAPCSLNPTREVISMSAPQSAAWQLQHDSKEAYYRQLHRFERQVHILMDP